MSLSAQEWLQKIHALPHPGRQVRIMNVCGGHERSITHAGMRTLLPAYVTLVPGPGCPVCVCSEQDIYAAMQMAMQHPVTLLAFGDMLRVPVNVPKSQPRSLDEARGRGADIRPVASPLEVLRLARELAPRPVVFFAAGFETTMAPVAGLLVDQSQLPDNLSVLLSGKLTWPAVDLLLQSGQPGFDALVAPGHVATIMGANEWQFVCQNHGLPAAVAGFGHESLLAAFYSVLCQCQTGQAALDNCYPEIVKPEGNLRAQAALQQVFQITASHWRGIGSIPASGYGWQPAYAHLDALQRHPVPMDEQRKRAGEQPPGCDCAAVVLAKKQPDQCRLYGSACTPRHPIGPCMVSDEGACRIWWAAGVRQATAAVE